MVRIAMSAAASGLLRALIARAGVPRDRILLTDLLSDDGNRSPLSASAIKFPGGLPDPIRMLSRDA
jgi:hypothetical protein